MEQDSKFRRFILKNKIDIEGYQNNTLAEGRTYRLTRDTSAEAHKSFKKLEHPYCLVFRHAPEKRARPLN